MNEDGKAQVGIIRKNEKSELLNLKNKNWGRYIELPKFLNGRTTVNINLCINCYVNIKGQIINQFSNLKII